MDEDKIILKLIEHDERFERIEDGVKGMVTKKEFTNAFEEIMTILKRLDEERPFTYAWSRRVEDEVNTMKEVSERHERELTRVKQELHIN